MQVTNRAFMGRPYISQSDTYQEVADTLDRLPFMVAIQTRKVPATDTRGASIVASCKVIQKCIQMAYAHEHSRHGSHYVAAMALVKRELPNKWENLAVLGSVEHGGGFLFCFGEDGLNT